MPYRYRPPMFSRRYMNSYINSFAPANAAVNETKSESARVEELNKVEIPLPNEVEVDAESASHPARKYSKPPISSFLHTLKSRIHIDDIILIGLLLLVLDEHLDDELFLILILYILLF